MEDKSPATSKTKWTDATTQAVTPTTPTKLHDFSDTHIDKDCQSLTGLYDNELFFNCKFKDLQGLTLKDCDLNRSQFLTEDIREALGFTLTLACPSFKNVEYSPLLFDLFLTMAVISRGNDEKRQKLVDVIGKERLIEILRIINSLER
jgi:hypothetical protein